MKRLSEKRLQELIDANFEKKNENFAGEDQECYVSKIDGAFMTFLPLVDDIKALFKKGITEQIQNRKGQPSTCNIGFNPEDKKWFGWSHRAICGFGIGHVVKKGQSRDSIPVGFKCKTLDDCKKVASDFAASVS
jgi:hypothetical protein